ncbi:MAG: TonB-dependent receptor plug domain-containing protein [Endomicrobia bacterium]|nr:TonB-dependent receptor plug domain-containing protein [Endomicrobiia bacterium]
MNAILCFSLTFLASLGLCYEVYLDAEKSGLVRENLIIKSEEIRKINPSNLSQLLKLYNINIYTRSDAQQDISLSGGSFQQVKVLLNGIPINDPQTGHHNFNIPVDVEDIEYIEILQNENLSKYSDAAFNGIINIVTKKDKPNFVKTSYGSFDTIDAYINLCSQQNSISASIKKTNGYRENTDLVSYNILYDGRLHNTDVSFGFLDKKFGAQDFYALNRKEYEQVRTIFFSVSPKIYLKENIVVKNNIFFRTGYDFYTTQRSTPTIYSNYHNSYMYGVNNCVDFIFNNFTLQPKVEVLFKTLDSKGFSSVLPTWKGLGEFYDYELRFGMDSFFVYKKFSFDTSLVGNYYSRYGFIPQAGIKLNYYVFEPLSLFFIVSDVHRTPSYTELYYWDPAHQANDELKVEETNLYRAGVNFKLFRIIGCTLSGFSYDVVNLIDWERTVNTTRWYIANIAKVKTYGGEFRTNFSYNNFGFHLYYDYVKKDFELDPTKELKYIDNYPVHSLGMILSFTKILGFDIVISNSFKESTKTQPKKVLLTNISLTKRINKLDIGITVENLFDIKYHEIIGLQAPPRKVLSSLKFYF